MIETAKICCRQTQAMASKSRPEMGNQAKAHTVDVMSITLNFSQWNKSKHKYQI